MRFFKNAAVASAVCPFWSKLAKPLEASLKKMLVAKFKKIGMPLAFWPLVSKVAKPSGASPKRFVLFFKNMRMPQVILQFLSKHAKMATWLGASKVFF